MLIISDYYEARRHVGSTPNILSINDPGLHAISPKHQMLIPNFLELHFYDYSIKERELPNAPQAEHISAIIGWAGVCKTFDIMIHCGAGLSRSTAAALITLNELGCTPRLAVTIVFKLRKLATPNRLMLELYGYDELTQLTEKKENEISEYYDRLLQKKPA